MSSNSYTSKVYDGNVGIKNTIFGYYFSFPQYLMGFWNFFLGISHFLKKIFSQQRFPRYFSLFRYSTRVSENCVIGFRIQSLVNPFVSRNEWNPDCIFWNLTCVRKPFWARLWVSKWIGFLRKRLFFRMYCISCDPRAYYNSPMD
jgi:hypothetical protein